MNHSLPVTPKVRRGLAVSVLAGGFLLSLLGDCNDRLVQFTRFVDPCGTLFQNCAPGDFEVRNAGIADFCVDPTCIVPGGCTAAGSVGGTNQPLGTLTDVCP